MSSLNQILIFTQIALETLPISSSAHVILVKKFYENNFGAALDLLPGQFFQLCNIPTLIVLAIYFGKEIFEFLPKKSKDLDLKNEKSPLYKLINITALGVIACVITAFVYITAKKTAPHKTFIPTHPLTLGLAMMASLLALLSLKLIKDKSSKNKEFKLSISGAVLIGLVQSISIAPGISRFASTYVTCRWLGNGGGKSIRFSFFLHSLLSLALLAKSVICNWAETSEMLCTFLRTISIPAFAVALLLSLAFLKLSDKVANKHKMWKFALYYPLPILAIFLLSVA